MEFRILGPIEALRNGDQIALSGMKAQTVLAALLLARGRVVSDTRLSSLLWGWNPPATMNAQIYTYVSRLRKRLGPEVDLIRQPPGYLIRTNDARVDTFEFERLDEEGRRAHAQQRFDRAAALLRSALDLWRGPALANVTEHLAEEEVPRLEEAWAGTLERRIDADLALGRHEDLMPELAGLVARFPVRERLRAQFMTALYRSGRQADALETYQQGRRLLAEELGVDPGPELCRAYRAVLDGDLEPPATALLVTAAFPSAAEKPAPAAVLALPPSPATLPSAGVDVVGRDALLADIGARLTAAGPHDGLPSHRAPGAARETGRERLPGHGRIVPAGAGTPGAPGSASPALRRVLLTGMPGAGKTALAVSVAASLAAHYPDGQLYVDLSGPDGAPGGLRQVLVRQLRALGDSEGCSLDTDALGFDDLLCRYRARTAGRRLLVVLDGAVGDRQILPLLPTGPEAGLLLTARRPLATIPPADTVHIGPMTRTDSLALLSAVAGADRVAAEPAAADAIAEHCADLPLALRIAGARLAARPHWSLDRLRQRLANPAARPRELRYGDLDLSRAFAVCLPRLAPAELEGLARLAAVLSGPFRAVAGARVMELPVRRTEDLLEELVDAALLEMAGVDRKSRPLYRFHPLVRTFAAALPPTTPADRLGEALAS
ncbi:BTAD domain-containing putative transcriptional regulator [Streptomyces sp. NPDC059168]|uniref:AfsR/SARP family transcriptional regulator n=1 Tax=Streptomyces sp. NPDC059168 TaxID=3346753 RepID=UPI00368C0768